MTGVLSVWLLETTIKGSVLIVLVAILQKLIAPRVDARWRHLLWVVVLVRLLLPVAPRSPLSVFNLVEPASPRVISVQPEVMTVEAVRVRVTPTRNVLPWVIGVWLGGALVFAARMMISAIRMRRAIPESREPTAGSPIPLIECDAVRTPALHGVMKPVLLLPRGFRETFSADELRHVLLHELWHVRRMDVAVSWLLAIVQCLHWFNPLVWFAGARIREERELACDELALSLLEEDERPGYGRTVLKLLERFRPASPLPAVVGIVNGKRKMKRRLTMIASFRNGTRFTALFLMLAAAVAVAALTDAPVGARKFIRKLDPSAHASMEKLSQRVTFELTSGSLSDLLTAISNETGVPITQEPALATMDVQKARFNIKADNVPAHIVLMEALKPFELSPEPRANGVSITNAPEGETGPMSKARVEAEASAGGGDRVVRFVERKELRPGVTNVEERVIVRARASEEEPVDGDRLRRRIKIDIDENGVNTVGTLSIEIEK